MRTACFCLLLLLTTVTTSFAEPVGDFTRQEALHRVWERYFPKLTPRMTVFSELPGRYVGDSPELHAFSSTSQWAWRQSCYEIYFASAAELARSIFGLALDTGDVPHDMPLDRFEKGAQGFRYNVDQVCRWANKLMQGHIPTNTVEERRLLDWLFMDGVLNIHNGTVVPGGALRHILGAADGKKRKFILNLAHERLHVLWKEDTAFKVTSLTLWQSMSQKEKEAVYVSLPGYAKDNENKIIEEWAVRRAEQMPPEERSKLVGI